MREACPRCRTHDQVATFPERPGPPHPGPYTHECVRCGLRWGHHCWHCHDDPPAGHTCPSCGREAA